MTESGHSLVLLGKSFAGEKGLCDTLHKDQGQLVYGRIKRYECQVKFRIYRPVFGEDGKASVPYMAIISIGMHDHPPPPASKVPPHVKELLLELARLHGLETATARRLLSSAMLPKVFHNAPSLATAHVALLNNDRVNRMIQRERVKQYPYGMDFLGEFVNPELICDAGADWK
jgi:hypothetical protein